MAIAKQFELLFGPTSTASDHGPPRPLSHSSSSESPDTSDGAADASNRRRPQRFDATAHQNDGAGEPRLLTVSQAAQMLAVSPRTVYRVIAEGRLRPPVSVRGASRLLVDEIEAYLAELVKER